MNIQIRTMLAGFAGLMAMGITAQAQYTWTTLREPLAGIGTNGPDTIPGSISGTNIVGAYGYFLRNNGVIHGFLLSGTNWITLDAPLAGSGPNQGTSATAISGTNIVGWFVDRSSVFHGFFQHGSTWTTLDDPQADLSPSGGTYAFGIDGTNISGHFTDASGLTHAFLYNLVTSTWRTLDDPLAGSGSGQGTFGGQISGGNIEGQYTDANRIDHGFVYNIASNAWTTLKDPLAGSAPGQGTFPLGISGTNILGAYTDGHNNSHGFLYNLVTSTWKTLDAPQANPGNYPVGGTDALGMEGTSIVGIYIDANGVYQGFLATPTPRLAITLSAGSLRVSWAYSNLPWTSWTLQQNPGLDTTNWTPSGTASNDGTNTFLSIPAPAGNLFFRLTAQ